MARIDPLIHHLFEFGADALGIGGGHQVMLVTKGERRPITAAALSPVAVRALLGEVMPPDVESTLIVENKVNFTYVSPSGPVNIEAEVTDGGPRMIVSRAVQKKVEPVEAAPRSDSAFNMPRTGKFDIDELTDSLGPSARAPKSVTATPRMATPLSQLPPQQDPTPPPVAEAAAAAAAPAAAAPPAAAPPASASRASPTAAGEPSRPDIPEAVFGQPTLLDPYLRALVEKGGSDLYICSGKPALMRRDGDLVGLGESNAFDVEQATRLLYSITPMPMRQQYEETHDVDFAYEIPGCARFRVNLFEDRMGIGGIMRQIPATVLSAEQLGLSKAILNLCTLPKGLVLVTGPTGSGKSTTLAGMIDYINATQSKHIITIEDPVEFVHVDKRSVINQREVHVNTESFKRALRAALREDPDIVLVGELRDLETVAIAIETAETGHLVFGTLHTNTASSTIDRIIDQFPADQQAQIRTMLASSLIGVVSQTLLKRKTGGRAAAQEVLIATPSVSNLIREAKTFQLPSIMQTGKSLGMVTMNDALLALIKNGDVEPAEALSKAIKKDEFLSVLRSNNIPLNG